MTNLLAVLFLANCHTARLACSSEVDCSRDHTPANSNSVAWLSSPVHYPLLPYFPYQIKLAVSERITFWKTALHDLPSVIRFGSIVIEISYAVNKKWSAASHRPAIFPIRESQLFYDCEIGERNPVSEVSLFEVSLPYVGNDSGPTSGEETFAGRSNFQISQRHFLLCRGIGQRLQYY